MRVLLLSASADSLRPAFLECGDEILIHTDVVDASMCLSKGIEFIVSYGYRHILHKEVLDLFSLRAINLHISLLPYNRGAHPNFWAFAQNTPSGVSIHLLDEHLDTGNILFQKEVFIDPQLNTFASSYDLLTREMASLFRLNWKYIRTAECAGWRQQGPASYHKSMDINNWLDCLPSMWDTPISVFRDLASAKAQRWYMQCDDVDKYTDLK